MPTLLWIDASDHALTALVVLGLVASVLLIANVAPKISIAACLVLFVSFVSAASEFSEYQSDGMLLEAAAIGFFLAPSGLRPKLGESEPPTRAAMFLLKWEWFRIYFESGIVKLASGDVSWRDFTAMDHYYENGPLPTWIGWYA
ncbi:MAG TPA: lipase maturation factor family protein, partial [Polyangiaceae bacterium]